MYVYYKYILFWNIFFTKNLTKQHKLKQKQKTIFCHFKFFFPKKLKKMWASLKARSPFKAELGPYFLGPFLHQSFLARPDKAESLIGPAQNGSYGPF
jgi:hypothetical protein